MHLAEARTLAVELMRLHGLHGWTFRFDRARRRFGSCRPQARRITLSRPLTLLNPESEVRDTILHEIAHALEPGAGHGPRWRAACARLGARPARCFTQDQVLCPPRRAAACEIGCARCAWWQDRRRLTPSRYRCRHCGDPVYYRQKATGRLFLISAQRQWRWLISPQPPAETTQLTDGSGGISRPSNGRPSASSSMNRDH